MPLVETHLHLEGSIPRRVLSRLARRAGAALPPGIPRPGHGLQRDRGFGRFLDAFVFCASLLRTRDDVEEAAFALLEDLRAEGVVYAEILFSPQVHLRRGMPIGSLLSALSAARRRAREAGGPESAFIADAGRLWGPAWFEEIIGQIAAANDGSVVAVGLGGDEAAAPARAFRRAFDAARAAQLGVVAHAGEGTSARSVREAIEELGVTRIGHGIAAASDPALMKVLSRRGICLEICPTSNVMTGAVRSLRAHPLRRLLDAGVPVALGSDDRSIFGTTLRGELNLAISTLGVGSNEVPGLLKAAAGATFRSGWRSRKREAWAGAGSLSGSSGGRAARI